ncbi:hypothetical protein JMUB7504_27690 [Staphylococcus aureus]
MAMEVGQIHLEGCLKKILRKYSNKNLKTVYEIYGYENSH